MLAKTNVVKATFGTAFKDGALQSLAKLRVPSRMPKAASSELPERVQGTTLETLGGALYGDPCSFRDYLGI